MEKNVKHPGLHNDNPQHRQKTDDLEKTHPENDLHENFPQEYEEFIDDTPNWNSRVKKNRNTPAQSNSEEEKDEDQEEEGEHKGRS